MQTKRAVLDRKAGTGGARISPWSLKMGFPDRIAMMAAQLMCSAFKAQESSVL
jgi:hypothetical protein